jgi:hypothetical protein
MIWWYCAASSSRAAAKKAKTSTLSTEQQSFVSKFYSDWNGGAPEIKYVISRAHV